MKVHLKIWRQENSSAAGHFEEHFLDEINEDMSFLEMLDVLNERLTLEEKPNISFSHDCREGICGSCGVVINGHAHGPLKGVTTCQIHMRHLKKFKTLVIEPWRVKAFPVIKDLVVDRSAFDRILQAGGYISVNTGGVPDANAIAISKFESDEAFMAASCIGCGACAAVCPNSSALLFTAAKISHLAQLPQGKIEAYHRVLEMVRALDKEGFGACSSSRACEIECPKGLSLKHVAQLNREFFKASLVAHLVEHPTMGYHGKGDDDLHSHIDEGSHIHHEEK